MANVDVTVASDLDAGKAWKLASDLSRIGDWLTIFAGWRSPVPEELHKGACVSSCIKVKGFRNVIHWTVTRYDEPEVLELTGRGRPGIRITLAIEISEAPEGQDGSKFHVVADLSGGVLAGPIGKLVARVVQSEIRKSVKNLAALR
jgi:hypothetical protein